MWGSLAGREYLEDKNLLEEEEEDQQLDGDKEKQVNNLQNPYERKVGLALSVSTTGLIQRSVNKWAKRVLLVYTNRAPPVSFWSQKEKKKNTTEVNCRNSYQVNICSL